jgi:hypothetical protein
MEALGHAYGLNKIGIIASFASIPREGYHAEWRDKIGIPHYGLEGLVVVTVMGACPVEQETLPRAGNSELFYRFLHPMREGRDPGPLSRASHRSRAKPLVCSYHTTLVGFFKALLRSSLYPPVQYCCQAAFASLEIHSIKVHPRDRWRWRSITGLRSPTAASAKR